MKNSDPSKLRKRSLWRLPAAAAQATRNDGFQPLEYGEFGKQLRATRWRSINGWKPSLLVVIFLLISSTVASAQTSLADLAEKQQWKQLSESLQTGDVNATQGDGMTALHWAAWHNDVTTVKKLVGANASIDAKTEYSVTPLSLACERGNCPVVSLLIKASAEIEATRLGKERPLMLAARQGHRTIVKLLIEAGAELDAKERGGQTALMWAAAAGNVDAVDALIEAGADINISVSDSGFTAFHFAARQGKTNVVERFIEAGFDVNATMEPKRTGGRKPRKSMSALLLAIESGHLELALRLIELGADANDQRSGFAPLHAISWVRKTQVGDDPLGDPAPRITGSISSLEFVDRLIKAGADVNLRLDKGDSPGKAKLKPKGMTPFMFAASTADIPLMKLLLKHGADPKVSNDDGCTPLMACAGVGVVAVGEYPGTEEEVDEAIRMLIKLGVDPNAIDANGETAIHGAAYRNYPSAVTVLTECGADPDVWNKKNKHGWTPHMIASGKRPGSVKPSPPTLKALDAAMERAE